MAISFVGFSSVRRAQASNGAVTTTVPTGTQAGDLLIAVRLFGPIQTDVAPAGWTLVPIRSSVYARNTSVWWRFATASETPEAWTSRQQSITVLAYRGVDQTTPIGDTPTPRTDTNAPTTPAITPTSAPGLTVLIWSMSSTAASGDASTFVATSASSGTVRSTEKPGSSDASKERIIVTGDLAFTTTAAQPASVLSFTGGGTTVYSAGHSIALNPAADTDTTPPVVNLSTAASQTVSPTFPYDYAFQVSEACQAWKIKVTPAADSVHTAGTEIESGGAVASGGTVSGSITASELQAAGVTEGSTVYVRFYAQDTAGNWSE